MPAASDAKLQEGIEELLSHVKFIKHILASPVKGASVPENLADDPSAFDRLLSALSVQHSHEVAHARTRNLPVDDLLMTTPSSTGLDDGSLLEARPSSTSLPQLPLPNTVADASVDVDGKTGPAELVVDEAQDTGRVKRQVLELTDQDSNKESSKAAVKKEHKEAFGAASRLVGNTVEKSFRNDRENKSSAKLAGFKGISKLVRTPTFDYISSVLLLTNALFIGIQVEFEFADSIPLSIDYVDYTFTILFVLEIAFRLYGFGCRFFWIDSPDKYWNIFDFNIVAFSTIDSLISLALQGQSTVLENISVLRIVRIVRITRVLRIIRVMKAFKDLRVLLAAIGSTVKTGVYAFALIFAAMWMFAIAITQLVAEHVRQNGHGDEESELDVSRMFFFGSLWRSLLTLYMTISGGIDWRDAAHPLYEVNPLAVTFFVAYTLIMSLCILNVLTGIFCQAAIETAAADQESIIEYQLEEKRRYVETLKDLFSSFDEDGNGTCSFEEFQMHLSDSTMQALLRSLEIEVRDAVTLFELLDADGTGEMDLEEFITGCITLRGSAKAVHTEKMNSMIKNMDKQMIYLGEQMSKLLARSALGNATEPDEMSSGEQ